MRALADGSRALAFILTTLVVLLSPWLFGAWEMWWFWPLATLLFAAVACGGLALILGAPDPADAPRRGVGRMLLGALPFALYTAVRAAQVDVRLDAERSLLLVLTPLLVITLLLYACTAAQRASLLRLVALNLLLLGLYAILNHAVTGSRLVLWAPGFPQYLEQHRMTGSYFCPDHFAGIMEMACALGLAMLLRSRRYVVLLLVGAALLLVGVTGVLMSKSRGGLLTLGVIAMASLVWGLSHLPRGARPWWRLATLCFLGVSLLTLAAFGRRFVERFEVYLPWREMQDKPAREALALVRDRISGDSRTQMFAGALRAWGETPTTRWLGIGPGMHETIWPHVAATPDGDRASRRWPSHPNYSHHANAVHNDWIQLLEEFGLVGFALFTFAYGWGFLVLQQPLAREARRTRDAKDDARLHTMEGVAILAAVLAVAALSFHALVDFNLQMPGTLWMLAALIAVGLGSRESVAARAES